MKFYIIFLFFSNLNAQNDIDCNRWTADHLTNANDGEYLNSTTYLVQFKDFDELTSIPCNQFKIKVDYIGMRPISKISLETNFDFVHLFNLFEFYGQSEKIAKLLNFDGFNKQSHGRHLKLNTFSDEYQLSFMKTTFRFNLDNAFVSIK